MSIDDHLDKLREKPDHVKRQIAFWTSLGFTGFIFVFWFSSLSIVRPDSQAKVIAEKADSPAENLVASVGSLFGDIVDMVFAPKKVIYSEVELIPGDK